MSLLIKDWNQGCPCYSRNGTRDVLIIQGMEPGMSVLFKGLINSLLSSDIPHDGHWLLVWLSVSPPRPEGFLPCLERGCERATISVGKRDRHSEVSCFRYWAFRGAEIIIQGSISRYV